MRLSASTNPPKEEELLEYCKELESLHVDMIHCDCMDGHFVPATCLELPKLLEVSRATSTPLDCHVMINSPIKLMKKYVEAGVTIFTFHYEAEFGSTLDFAIRQKLKKIRRKFPRVMLGIAIKPSTGVNMLNNIIDLIDVILIMSVEPGKSGQEFINSALNKIAEARQLVIRSGTSTLIEVDGGVNLDNIKSIAKAGADIVVMGSALYKAKNRAKVIDAVHSCTSE